MLHLLIKYTVSLLTKQGHSRRAAAQTKVVATGEGMGMGMGMGRLAIGTGSGNHGGGNDTDVNHQMRKAKIIFGLRA